MIRMVGRGEKENKRGAPAGLLLAKKVTTNQPPKKGGRKCNSPPHTERTGKGEKGKKKEITTHK